MSGTIILFIIGSIIVLAVRYPVHAKKVFAGVGRTMSSVSSTATAPATPTGEQVWLTKKQWSILILLVGAMAIYWGSQNTQIGTADAGSWARNHWIPLLTLWGVGAALVAINAPEKAKLSLQWVLAGVMFMLFIGLPILGWFGESKTPPPTGQKQQAEKAIPSRPVALIAVPLASTPPSSWPKVAIPAGGKSEMIPIPPGMYIVMDGKDFVLHTVYTDGHECSFEESGICPAGSYVGSYARNKSAETNTVSYAFAPMR